MPDQKPETVKWLFRCPDCGRLCDPNETGHQHADGKWIQTKSFASDETKRRMIDGVLK